MSKSKDFLKLYKQSKNELMQHFQCDNEFFVKPLDNCKWAVKNDEDFSFLVYWSEDEKRHDAVIVKKNGEPMIIRKSKYTMVVAIDCVKIAFIFENSLETSEN